MDIRHFKEQHIEILGLIKDMERYCNKGITNHKDELSRGLMMLRFKVKLHLATEDKFLYPAIGTQPNAAVSHLSGFMREEMTGISTDFLMFSTRWERADAIYTKADRFYEDTTHIIKVLRHRIQHENTEFYPAIEQLGSSAPAIAHLKH